MRVPIHICLWKCPTCWKLKRTLTRFRVDKPPVCLHWFTPYDQRPPSQMGHVVK